jgi:hypothetical protein
MESIMEDGCTKSEQLEENITTLTPAAPVANPKTIYMVWIMMAIIPPGPPLSLTSRVIFCRESLPTVRRCISRCQKELKSFMAVERIFNCC